MQIFQLALNSKSLEQWQRKEPIFLSDRLVYRTTFPEKIQCSSQGYIKYNKIFKKAKVEG